MTPRERTLLLLAGGVPLGPCGMDMFADRIESAIASAEAEAYERAAKALETIADYPFPGGDEKTVGVVRGCAAHIRALAPKEQR